MGNNNFTFNVYKFYKNIEQYSVDPNLLHTVFAALKSINMSDDQQFFFNTNAIFLNDNHIC